MSENFFWSETPTVRCTLKVFGTRQIGRFVITYYNFYYAFNKHVHSKIHNYCIPHKHTVTFARTNTLTYTNTHIHITIQHV